MDLNRDLVVWPGCILLFAAGVIWGMIPDKAGFFVVPNIHDLFDILGALATMIAAAVAVVALTNWRSQFRHEARFQSLKDLKDAATELHTFRGYLIAIQARCMHLMHSGGVRDESINQHEEASKQSWTNALQRYNKAWGTAVVFFTAEEEASFSGPAPIYVKRSLDDPMRIVMAYANASDVENIMQFAETCRGITDEVRDLYASTVSELEMMLRQKYKT